MSRRRQRVECPATITIRGTVYRCQRAQSLMRATHMQHEWVSHIREAGGRLALVWHRRVSLEEVRDFEVHRQRAEAQAEGSW